MPARPRVCLFDLDGTLIDSVPLILASFRHTFTATFGSAPPDSAWIAGMGRPLIDQLRDLVGDASLARQMADTYREFQDAHHDQLVRQFPGVREALLDLRERGHRVGVVTSKMREAALRGLLHAGLDSMVEIVIDAESSTRHKPHPEPVLLALAAFERTAQEAVFAGDSPHDIAAGRAAGVRTIATLCGPFSREQLEPAGPDAIVAGVPEVPATVAAWEVG
jgi:pyrophosphatase PpaX